MKRPFLIVFSLFWLGITSSIAQSLSAYDPVWTTMSKNASESMPLGGGDIGMNVWVEDGELLFYFSRSGTFDEHNTLLKLGRVRVSFTPNPFDGDDIFRQELNLQEGNIKLTGKTGGKEVTINLWVDVFRPVIHVEVDGDTPTYMDVAYENWRYKNRPVKGAANNANSYKWAPQGEVITYQDSIGFQDSSVLFYHQNRANTVFDVAVEQQKMASVKGQMMNPLSNLIFGGVLEGGNLIRQSVKNGVYQDTDFKAFPLKSISPRKHHSFEIYLHTAQTRSVEKWKSGLDSLVQTAKTASPEARKNTTAWWKGYWKRSYVITDPQQKAANDTVWQIGRNYQLFRYMLGCNAYGSYPTKFNGGLFTVDPVYTKPDMPFTPDHRNWGGGTMTAQNQRLVYFPMLRSGDFDLMKPQFDFYLRLLKNAELRSQVYWGHEGASFTEQIENFGLPNPAEYNWKRPDDYDPGMQYNAWLEYQWDTVLEFCLMMLEQERYADKDISEYIPFIESCLRFFDQHYQYLAQQRGAKTLDENGDLVLYPGSANETYKMAYNANSTISALQTVLKRLIASPSVTSAAKWQEMLERIPPLNFREINGHRMLAPAKLWERINNTEVPQLYPVYPWGIYGIGRPDLQIAINTYQYDPDALKFRSHIGWKQDNIFAARLGLTAEAAKWTLKKMGDSERRFPTFWGPGFDWVPDHNWGGSGMIGMQEMLLQTDGDNIYLFPAWPKDWDVQFKLHAPRQTTVEGVLEDGKLKELNVLPKEREADIVNMLGWDLEKKAGFK
ncbi:hypothetical protein DN752_14410 [Echinicola strongylocentroti]|uniref:DUF5703 domain-containing protein n=1 Tax=Echinicola strongylocentroti TaxID=1795355 RepID=A0A2Z4IKY3_9BACT|nr:DUF5703 domain-containing protein [Echinicola strongylocentroti]AWW31218.1 hypothetical protein DN752_14410 [Echinicola strongylocentroti]